MNKWSKVRAERAAVSQNYFLQQLPTNHIYMLFLRLNIGRCHLLQRYKERTTKAATNNSVLITNNCTWIKRLKTASMFPSWSHTVTPSHNRQHKTGQVSVHFMVSERFVWHKYNGFMFSKGRIYTSVKCIRDSWLQHTQRALNPAWRQDIQQKKKKKKQTIICQTLWLFVVNEITRFLDFVSYIMTYSAQPLETFQFFCNAK